MDAEYDRIAYDAEQQLNEIRNRHRRDYGRRESMNTCPTSISHISSTCQKTKSLTTVSTATQNNSDLELTNQENTGSTPK